MKDGICKYIPLALMVAAVACWMAPAAAPQGPPETPAIEPTTGDEVQLAYWIANAPAEIEAIAESLGVERIAYVPPRYYTKGNPAKGTPRTFSREKAEENLDAIKAICDGATWIISDIEWEQRRIVRRPQDYSEATVKATVDQYVACWSWFRSHWPNALVFEWNLTNAGKPGVATFAEQLVLKHLDGFAISIFWHDRAKWRDVVGRSVAHANALVAPHDKIVICGIWERYKIQHDDGVSEIAPVPREGVDAMIEVALGGDVVFFWSNSHRRFASSGSKKVLTEIMNEGDDPLPGINAHVVRVLAEMRLRAEALP